MKSLESFFKTVDAQRASFCGYVPPRPETHQLVDDLFSLLFPITCTDQRPAAVRYEELRGRLCDLLAPLMDGENPCELTDAFFEDLPNLYGFLMEDAQASLRFDPAATSIEEIITIYPGFFAISVYRLAHQLYHLGVPLLPRMFTEYAHSKTGVDIHPAAEIGHSFFIDHGTGIVVGATARIGNNVKLYQGVTLGALQVEKKLADTKRHPTVEDDVIIYANAAILGGKTVIGRNSIIGGNVFITESVPPDSMVYHKSQMSVRSKTTGLEAINFVI